MKLELVVPTSLSEIPLKHYQKFLAIAENTNDEVFLAEKMIECFCGIQLKDVVKIPFSEVESLSNHFAQMFKQKTEFKSTFKILDKEFGFIPNLEHISWGEYIDLEANISDIKTFHKAMAVMYRPIVEKHGDKYKIEPYESAANYSEVMEFAPLDVSLAAKVFFLQFRKRIIDGYPVLFGDGDNEEQGDFSEFSERTQFSKNWGWYQSIYAVAKGDFTKFEAVTKLRLTAALTYLTFEKQKTEIEQRELNRQLKKGT